MNTNLPWLSLLWLAPLVGAGLVIMLPAGAARLAKWTGLLVSLATLAVAIVVTAGFDTTPVAAPTSSSNPIPGYRRSGRATRSAWTVSRWCWHC